MEIKIKDVDKYPMWALPEANLFLSMDNNKFLNVDIEDLSPMSKVVVWNSIQLGALVSKNDEDLKEYINRLHKPKKVSNTSQDKFAESVNRVQSVQQIKGLKNSELVKVLKSNVSTLKRELPDKSLSELRILQELEKNGKKRKTVVKIINELLNSEEKQVLDSVKNIENKNALTEEEYQEKQIYKGLERPYLDNLQSVVQSEEEEITIRFGEDDSS